VSKQDGTGRQVSAAPVDDPAAHIMHVDMDAFFASVELLERPELVGKPVIVGHPSARSVVTAATYEARRYGVNSAMPMALALRRCPHAIVLEPHFERYAHFSRLVMQILGEVTPHVEQLSVDEAFLDVAGARRLHGDAVTIAHALRQAVLDGEGLTCSVGVAPNKFLAKLASEAAKPKASVHGPQPGLGVKVVAPGEELAFLHPLPVQALWGVGPATLAKLERLAVRTVGDLAALPEATVVAALGNAAGRHLHRLAHGLDDRPVTPEQRPKSIGHEETFPRDHHRRDTLRREVVRLSDSVASRLRRHDLAGRTVTLKVRFGDFHTITRSTTLPAPVDGGTEIARAAKALLEGIDPSSGVRLIGVSVTGLSEDGARQLTLDDVDTRSWDEANGAVDAIRHRFGDDAIVPASLTGPGGIRVKRRGDQQWGPGEGV
jgi:DNA polymerase-4